MKANAWRGGFFQEAPKMTFGKSVELKNFTSIFDFLMMICYREGNPDMIPVRTVDISTILKIVLILEVHSLV